MGNRLTPLLEEIRELEERVAEKLQQASAEFPFEIQEGKIVFDPDVRQRHQELATRLWRYLCESSWLAVLTSPVIFSLLIPITMLDLLVCLFQWICFPVYGIPRVVRSEYVVMDRHHLRYLNLVEKVNCLYCSYANGVLAFAREVASRTEQYWCPIKHARRVKGCHGRHCLFCEYGDAEGFQREFNELRSRFSDVD